MSKRLQHLFPALTIALGILGASALSLRFQESNWLVMAGPFVLAASIILASELERRIHSSSYRRVWVASVVAVLYFIVATIVGMHDPSRVADIVVLLGAGAIVVLGSPGARGRCCGGTANSA